MVNINAQEWLDAKYPQNEACQRNNDQINKGKKRNEITHLDISSGKVGYKYFGEKVLVGELRLSGFANLKTLSVSSHQLTNLDLSDCPNLEALNCHNNQLTSLNITNFHYLRKINCANNNLRELDLNGCNELQELNCTNNPYLKEIDISHCPELTEQTINSDLVLNNEKKKLVKSISRMAKANDNEVRNILVVGMTGGGKSTLANVLTNTNKFEEMDSSTSITKNYKKSDVFEWAGIKYRIIDNVGFGDTDSLTVVDVLHEIGKGIYATKNKINQVLFVISGRFTPEQITAFNLFKNFIAESKIAEFTTLVRTNFSNFRNSSRSQADKEALLDESEELKEIINSCNGFLYVDNPAIPEAKDNDSFNEREIIINKKKRGESRKIVLEHLINNCQQVYQLKEWESINNQVIAYMQKIKKLERQQKELTKTGNNSTQSQIQNEINEERKKFAEEVNARMGIRIGLNPEISAEVELRDINCCSIL